MKKEMRKRFVTSLTGGLMALVLLAFPGSVFAADAPATVDPAAASTEALTEITYQEARDIALKDAGLEGKEVTWFETQKEKDKTTKIVGWELGFFLDDTEYDYEVNISTKEIIKKSSKQMDAEDKAENEQQAQTLAAILTDTSSYAITAEMALDTALKDAGIDAASAEVYKNNLDNDDGLIVYNVEFISGGMEYEYEIDSNSGAILEKDFEKVGEDD